MGNRTKAVYSQILNKFSVGDPDRYIAHEVRRAQKPKRWDNIREDNNSPHVDSVKKNLRQIWEFLALHC